MKTFFLKSVIMLNLLACFFNPIALTAHQFLYHKVTIFNERVTLNNEVESFENNDSILKKKKEEKSSHQHKYRPKMYRKLAAVCWFVVSAATLVFALWVTIMILPFATMGGAAFVLTISGCLLTIPLMACLAGVKNLEEI